MLGRFLVLLSIFVIASTQLPGDMKTYTYKTVGNLSIQLDVYTPSSSPYEKYPIFFCIHGGGYIEGNKSDAYSTPELNEMQALGFVAVAMDYRLSPGVLLDDMIQDIQDAYTWVRTELVNYVPIDPDMIIVWGRSAGGGLAVIEGYMLSPRPKAVIAFYPGSTNFTTLNNYNPDTPVNEVLVVAANELRTPVIVEYESTSKFNTRTVLADLVVLEMKTGWLLVSIDPKEPTEQVMASLKNYSAVYHVDTEYPPTYLIHGLKDEVVPYEQSVMLSDVLNSTKVQNVLDLVPDVNHFFDEDVQANSTMWEQHIEPSFDFAQHIIAAAYVDQTTKEISV